MTAIIPGPWSVTTARMKGWKTRNSAERRFRHLRLMGTANRSPVLAAYDYGAKDYFLGGSPLWQLFRGTYRMLKKPYIIGGIALLAGYGLAAIRRVKRPVSRELMQFHRREQMKKLRAILGSLIRFRKVNQFSLATAESDESRVTQ